jgi:hypothetical protein
VARFEKAARAAVEGDPLLQRDLDELVEDAKRVRFD